METNFKKLHEYLDYASKAYYTGTPIISDSEFDYLANLSGYNQVGYKPEAKQKHRFRMYSLKKFYEGESIPPEYPKGEVLTPKLDGAAISLLYYNGMLIQATTRGDGEIGENILEHVKFVKGIPHNPFIIDGYIQVTGEIVVPKEVQNARNVASGALHLKDISQVRGKGLQFIAYAIQPTRYDFYKDDIAYLRERKFRTVMDEGIGEEFDTDGWVCRADDNKEFEELGYTAKHPRGAYALKNPSDVVTLPTKLLDVKWQVGGSGKVTPVAIFEPVEIDGATVTRATLHNAKFVEDLNLSLGDTLLVTRRGGIIPYISGKL